MKTKHLFTHRRYWYHISTTLNRKEIRLKPWDNSKGFNRSGSEPDVERICVAPTLSHCFTAVPYCLSETYCVYRTIKRVLATSPKNVFDADITCEGWILTPTKFIKIGTITLEDIEKEVGEYKIIKEPASSGRVKSSKRAFKWWKKLKPERFLKRT